MWLIASAFASVLTVDDGQVSTVPIDEKGGVMVELPDWVHVVTPSEHLNIDPVKRGEGQGVKHLQVALKDGSTSDEVSFSLADGRVVSLRFVSAKVADRYLSVRFDEPEVVADQGFLSDERALLVAMFADDPARRTVLDEVVMFDQYPELVFRLLRRHTAPGLTGYTFEVANTTNAALELHPEVLSVGYPNRASLVQVDHAQLVSCEDEEGPRFGPEEVLTCSTLLRVVVVESQGGGLSVSSSAALRSKAPFAVVKVKTKKGKK